MFFKIAAQRKFTLQQVICFPTSCVATVTNKCTNVILGISGTLIQIEINIFRCCLSEAPRLFATSAAAIFFMAKNAPLIIFDLAQNEPKM